MEYENRILTDRRQNSGRTDAEELRHIRMAIESARRSAGRELTAPEVRVAVAAGRRNHEARQTASDAAEARAMIDSNSAKRGEIAAIEERHTRPFAKEHARLDRAEAIARKGEKGTSSHRQCRLILALRTGHLPPAC